MGVTGIWDHMNRYASNVELASLRGKTLTIDGHIWLYESVRGSTSHGNEQKNSYLVTFYKRCERLLECGINVIVVFDQVDAIFNANHQVCEEYVKRSKRAGGCGWDQSVHRELIERVFRVQELLSAMGVLCVVGGADGEAQCAQLEQAGISHGCITPDFDYFLFGGSNIYRLEFSQGGRVVSSVSHVSMEKLEEQNLNRHRLIALAMLLGCDYFEKGIGRVGVVTGLEIVAEFSLIEDDHPSTILDRFRSYCTKEVPLRKTDSQLKQKLRKQATRFSIPHGFPNSDLFLQAVDVFLVPDTKNVQKADLPVIGSMDVKRIEEVMTRHCDWDAARFASENERVEKRTAANKNSALQSRVTDFFCAQRPRRSTSRVVEECSEEEAAKCSRREWAALTTLRNKRRLYHETGDGVDEKEAALAAAHKRRCHPTAAAKRRGPPIKTTMCSLGDPAATSDTSSVQIIE